MRFSTLLTLAFATFALATPAQVSKLWMRDGAAAHVNVLTKAQALC